MQAQAVFSRSRLPCPLGIWMPLVALAVILPAASAHGNGDKPTVPEATASVIEDYLRAAARPGQEAAAAEIGVRLL